MTDSRLDVTLLLPSKESAANLDEEGKYHNENGPAYTTPYVSYFLNHGEDWTDEEYETFIRNKANELFPEDDLSTFPFSQLVSIVHTTENWEKRGTYNRPPIDWGELLKAVI